ncbi:MAG: SDR family NAD(P)-dependent oxidoreductase [Alphaproteobacteria bacterium]|nr:SDR family NAD(P)-dependent oxidoreductase [Alphaproteobacteria bacterium]
MKEILITGASSGIGRATSLAAAEAGWRVIACGRDQARLDALASEHAEIRTLAFDVANIEECRAALNAVSPDVVLLNAGTCEYVDIDRWDIELFRRVFNANFFGVVNCLDPLLPNLRRGSQLAFVDSLARLLPFTRSEAYGSSKAAVFYLAKTLEVDLKDRGVRVQTISPGFVETPLTESNDFAMPMQISAEEAATSIMQCITRKTRDGYFPTMFATIIRSLSLMPMRLQTALCGRLRSQATAETKASR